jgi:phenolic acid decarboxylase
MNEFYVDKQIMITHPDGWRYRIYTHDDPRIIAIAYEEQYGEDWVKKHEIDGLWGDAIPKIAEALMEMKDLV